jgi:cytochrome c556
MKFSIARILVGVAALGLAAGASAQSKPEDLIKFRQSGYSFMAWNMGKIKAQVVDGAVAYDKAQVAAAANAIAAIANSGMGALYAPGTDEGEGWKETRLKPEFFKEPEKVKEIAVNFVKQANALQTVAASGDEAAIKAQFGEVGKACKACHEQYREEE